MRTTIDLDPAQRRLVEHADGRLVALGGPGTGKTTALIERAAALVARGVEPSSILFFTGSRRAAIGLRDRLVRRLGRSVAGPSLLTFHGFAWSLLTRSFGVLTQHGTGSAVGYELAGYAAEPVLLTAFDQRALVRRLLLEESPERWPVNGAMLGSNAFAGEVRDFLLRAQERLETPGSIRRLAAARDRPEWFELADFYERYTGAVQDPAAFPDGRPRVDFAMVLSEARRVLGEHPMVLNDLHALYPHVLADDFEECNRAEAEFFEALAASDSAVTAVVAGDPLGSVFAFRGADPAHLVSLAGKTVAFDVSHRRAAPPEVRLYSHLTEEAQGAVAELRRAHHENGVPWRACAVIVRDLRTALPMLRREFARAGIPHQVDGESLRLADDPVVRPVLDLFAVACLRTGHELLWPSLLMSELGGFTAHDLVRLRRAARLRGVQLHELCGHPPPDLGGDLAPRLSAMCGLISSVRAWARDLTPDECFWRLWESSEWFARLVADNDERRLDSITTLSDALARFTDRRGGGRIVDFLETLESAEFAPESVRLDRARDAVTITTAHGSKGLEFEFATVAGCVEGMWPDPARRGTLLDVDLLEGPKDQATRARQALEEEERLFRLAVSRARHTILTGIRAGGSERASAEPSRFIEAIGATLPADNSSVPALVLSQREAETAWRRCLFDAGAPSARRLAALWGLARLPGVDPDRWWWGREWTHNAMPVAGGRKKTSYSRFSDYENCPLQYLLGQVLGLDPETTYHMAYGSLIHTLLEKAENGTLPRDFDALWAEAVRMWRDDAFPEGAIAEFLKRDCKEIIARYLAMEADNGHHTLACEEEFEFDVAGWRVRGKIDRIDRCGRDGIRVIDYKTSNSYKFQSEAEEDLQLATYLLACARDPKLAELGTPKVAELLFLRHEHQGNIRRVSQTPKHNETEGKDWEHAVEGRISALLGGIESEQFAPSPEAECRFCKFKELCPMWPEGAELSLR